MQTSVTINSICTAQEQLARRLCDRARRRPAALGGDGRRRDDRKPRRRGRRRRRRQGGGRGDWGKDGGGRRSSARAWLDGWRWRRRTTQLSKRERRMTACVMARGHAAGSTGCALVGCGLKCALPGPVHKASPLLAPDALAASRSSRAAA